jgi:hypothetical protein
MEVVATKRINISSRSSNTHLKVSRDKACNMDRLRQINTIIDSRDSSSIRRGAATKRMACTAIKIHIKEEGAIPGTLSKARTTRMVANK